MSEITDNLPATWRALLRAVVGLGLVVITAALLGCAGQPPSPNPSLPSTVGARELDQDVEYLTKLNALVKDRVLTDADRERLWQAYLARVQGVQASQAQVARQVRLSRPWPFVAPAF